MDRYHDYDSMTRKLAELNTIYPDTSFLYKLSETSVKGRELWVIQVRKKESQEDIRLWIVDVY